MLDFYQWKQNVVEVFEDDLTERTYYFIAEGIFDRIFDKRQEVIVHQMRLSEYPAGEGLYKYEYPEVLLGLRDFGRVIILTGVAHVVREFLIHADAVGFDNKEFAYIIIDIDNKLGKRPWIWPEAPSAEHRNSSAIRRQLESALIVRLKRQHGEDYEEYVSNMINSLGSNIVTDVDQGFLDIPDVDREKIEKALELIARNGDERIDFDVADYIKDNIYPALLYDSLLMAATVVNKSLEHHLAGKSANTLWDNSPDYDDIEKVLEKALNATSLIEVYIRNHTFSGITGNMTMNDDSDRITNYEVLDLNPEKDEFEVVGGYDSRSDVYEEYEGKKSIWPSGAPPPDVPKCGFEGRKCPTQRISVTEAVVISIVSLAVVIAIVSYTAYRKYKLAKELQSQLWRVLWCDITWLSDGTQNLGNGPIPGVFGGSIDYVDTQSSKRNALDMGRSDLSIAEVMSLPIPPMTPTIAMKRANKRSKIFRSRKWSNRVDDAEVQRGDAKRGRHDSVWRSWWD